MAYPARKLDGISISIHVKIKTGLFLCQWHALYESYHGGNFPYKSFDNRPCPCKNVLAKFKAQVS